MFPPFSLQAPCGRFNIDVGFFARVPQPDDALYEALLRNAELPSAPQCSARRHSRGAPCDEPMLGTSSSLRAIMPIWSSAVPPRPGSTGLAPLAVVMGHATPSRAGGLGARPVAHVRQGARGMPIYGLQCKEGTQCGLPPSFFELTLSSPQFPHEVAKRGKRKEEI
jgi:hypothetical protein